MSRGQGGYLIPFSKVLPKLEKYYDSDHLPTLSHSPSRENSWTSWKRHRPLAHSTTPGKPCHGSREHMGSAGPAHLNGIEVGAAQRAMVLAALAWSPCSVTCCKCQVSQALIYEMGLTIESL